MLTKRTSEQTPASRRRVLVTRAGEQAPVLSAGLRELGVEPIMVSTIEIIPPPSFVELDKAIAELDQVDYLILTSANAVNAFFDRMSALGQNKEVLAKIKTVAVGPKSAEALAERGIDVDLIPDDYRAEGVVSLLKERVAGKRLLYPKAGLARELIPAELAAAGAVVIAPVAYTSAPPVDAARKLKRALADGLDLLTFTSSSTVQNFFDLLDPENKSRAKQIPVASIGPLTSNTARGLGFEVVVEPHNSTLADLLEAIRKYFAQE